MILLEDHTANTDGSQDTFDWSAAQRRGNMSTVLRGTIVCEGTFNGATVTLKFQATTGGEWISCGDDTIFTEAGGATLEMVGGFKIRGDVTNAGGTTSVTLRALQG